MNKTLIATAVVCAALLGMTAAQAQASPAQPQPIVVDSDAPYRALGEKRGLAKLMDDFMTRLAADPRTGPFFGPANQQHITAQ